MISFDSAAFEKPTPTISDDSESTEGASRTGGDIQLSRHGSSQTSNEGIKIIDNKSFSTYDICVVVAH